MHKCEHSKTISSFCLSQHCQSKQAGGCQDCLRKYHNHIGQVAFLNEQDIKNIVKKFQIQHNYRPKSRSLQQSIFNFFTYIKNNLSSNFDIVCKNLINQIGYPYLHKNNNLNCYKRLKNKQYRKVTQRQLKQLNDLFKNTHIDQIIRQQKKIYNQAILKMQQTIQSMQKSVKQIFQTLNQMGKSNIVPYDKTFYLKINQTFKQIRKYPDISFPKSQPYKQKQQPKFLKEEQTQSKRKLNRDVSLDKHLKIQNKFKTNFQTKTPQLIISPSKKSQQNQKQINSSIKKDKAQSINQKQKNSRRLHKGSFQLKPQQISLRSPVNQKLQDYSQKQEQIIERKKKLMQLMNSKPVKKQQVQSKRNQNEALKTQGYNNYRVKTQVNKVQVGDQLKQQITPQKFLINSQFSGSSYRKSLKEQQRFKTKQYDYMNKFSSKRAKTAYQQQQQVSQSKKDTRNQTITSSQTETEPLFNAKIHIPFQDIKHDQEFEIRDQSRHKFVFVPQINIKGETFDQSQQCRSPLLIKKKEIQNFSAMMKLAESKIFQEDNLNSSTSGIKQIQDQKSFIKINKILNQHPTKGKKSNLDEKQCKILSQQNKFKSEESVQINQNEQKSLALLLHSLNLPASQAIVELQKSLAYSSNNLSAVEYLSYLYLQAQKPQDCLKLCNDTLKNISSSQNNQLALRLNINKSAALNHLGRYSQCITFLQRCLRNKHNDTLYKNLADAYYSIGILQKAIYNYEHAILQNSSNTQAHYNLAVCHYQQQNYHNASIYIDKALKHQANNQVYKQMQKHIQQKIFTNLLK